MSNTTHKELRSLVHRLRAEGYGDHEVTKLFEAVLLAKVSALRDLAEGSEYSPTERKLCRIAAEMADTGDTSILEYMVHRLELKMFLKTNKN